MLALEVWLVYQEEKLQHHHVMRLLSVAEADERAMAKHREEYPEDIQAEHKFCTNRTLKGTCRGDEEGRVGLPLSDASGPRQ
jgi:hypothetical protein